MIRTQKSGLDLVGLIRATNSLQTSSDEWLLQIQERIGRLLPQGPMVGYSFDFGQSDFRIGNLCTNCHEDLNSMREGMEPLFGEAFNTIYRSVGSGSGRQAFSSFGRDWPAKTKRVWGIEDTFGIMAGGRDGRGVAIGLGLDRVCEITSKDLAFWSGFSHCLRQSFEFRDYLAKIVDSQSEVQYQDQLHDRDVENDSNPFLNQSRNSISEIEQSVAIMDCKGNLLHDKSGAQHPDIRHELREKVLLLHRNYHNLHAADSHDAARIWEDTKRGKWMVVDQFDSDGRQFWVAVPTTIDIQSSLKLSVREKKVLAFSLRGQTQKWIAVELGIHASAVNRALESALLKVMPNSRRRSPIGDEIKKMDGHNQFEKLLALARWLHSDSVCKTSTN